MCLAIPGRIVSVDASDPASPVARIDYGSVQKDASLLYVPEAGIGDYVIVHAGFATSRLSPEEAREAIELREEMVRAAAGGASSGDAASVPSSAAASRPMTDRSPPRVDG